MSGDEIELVVVANGDSVIRADFVSFSRSLTNSSVTIDVDQIGIDTVTVTATYVHSIVR